MKKLLLALALLLVPVLSHAQIFGNATQILGTSNSVVIVTNTVYVPVSAVALQLSGFTNSGTVFTGSTLFTLDKINFFSAASFTYTGSTNFSTNIPASTIAVPVYTYLRAATGTNAVNVFAY